VDNPSGPPRTRAARPDGPSAATLQVLEGPGLLIAGERTALPESSLRFLIFLALRRRPVRRSVVAAALWPHSDEARAGGNLRSAMWRLGGTRAGIVDVVTDGLVMCPDVSVDLETVSRWAERVTAGSESVADLQVPDSIDAALDLLPGWYDDWVVFERERVRARALHALEHVSRLLSAAGRHAQAVDAAIAAVCSEPLRESAQRALVLAHLAEGNQVEAHRSFHAYRSLLETELGVVPSPEFHELVAFPVCRGTPRRPGERVASSTPRRGLAPSR
jgi:DNA-binding SARP family transcriptional activator